jgi:hypothetical protein
MDNVLDWKCAMYRSRASIKCWLTNQCWSDMKRHAVYCTSLECFTRWIRSDCRKTHLVTHEVSWNQHSYFRTPYGSRLLKQRIVIADSSAGPRWSRDCHNVSLGSEYVVPVIKHGLWLKLEPLQLSTMESRHCHPRVWSTKFCRSNRLPRDPRILRQIPSQI